MSRPNRGSKKSRSLWILLPTKREGGRKRNGRSAPAFFWGYLVVPEASGSHENYRVVVFSASQLALEKKYALR